MLEDIPRGLGVSLCGKAREALPATGRRRKPSAARATPGLASVRSGPRPVPEGALGPGAAGRRELRLVLNASIYSSRETQPLSAIHTSRAGGAQGCGAAGDAVLLCRCPARCRAPCSPRPAGGPYTTERPAGLCAARAAPEAPRAGPRADFRPHRAGGGAGFVSRPAGRAASGPRAGRAPSSRRWAPGEWRVPGRGRGRGRQGPPIGRTGGLSAVGPHGGPGAWATVSPAPGSRHGRPRWAAVRPGARSFSP